MIGPSHDLVSLNQFIREIIIVGIGLLVLKLLPPTKRYFRRKKVKRLMKTMPTNMKTDSKKIYAEYLEILKEETEK